MPAKDNRNLFIISIIIIIIIIIIYFFSIQYFFYQLSIGDPTCSFFNHGVCITEEI